jgi:hypothetical protein
MSLGAKSTHSVTLSLAYRAPFVIRLNLLWCHDSLIKYINQNNNASSRWISTLFSLVMSAWLFRCCLCYGIVRSWLAVCNAKNILFGHCIAATLEFGASHSAEKMFTRVLIENYCDVFTRTFWETEERLFSELGNQH